MEKWRNLTNNIFFKIFLSFVGISFITFGIGDFILGMSNSWIAKVDGKKIAYSEYIRELQNNRERIYRANPSEQVLSYLNSSQFKTDTVNNLVTARLISEMQEYFGIYPDKDLVLQDIAAHPQFKNSQGNFNRVAFINYLKINGLNEDKFIEDVSRELVSQIVTSSLIYDPIKNEKLAKEVYSYREEKRRADVISISMDNVARPKNPKREELVEFFEKNQEKFVLPEFRELIYIEFSEKDIMPKIKVSDLEIVDYYQNSSIYVHPSTKDFYHLLFDDEISASKFLSNFNEESQKTGNKKQTFIDLALKFQNRQEEDILLDGLTNEDLLPEIVNDVFALNVGDNSSVLSSPLGFHVFYFEKENPEYREKLTAKIKSEIKENLLSERRDEILVSKIEEIDDKILNTNSLKKVAKEFNLPLKNLGKFDNNGLNVNKRDVAGKVNLDGFVRNSFTLPKQETSELFYSKTNDKYYALFITKIEESRNQDLGEVLGQVTKLLIEKKRKEKLVKLANNIYNQIQNKQSSIAHILQKNNLKVKRNKTFQRFYEVQVGDKTVDYTNDFLKDLFSSGVGKVTNPHAVSDKEIHIGIVKKIISPKINKKKINDLKQKLASEFKNNVLNGYDNYIQSKFPIQINNKLLNSEDNL